MADKITPERRSANMARIRGKDTKPEIALRSALHRQGYRFRKHVKALPGKPDIVFPGRRKVIFVHGCFWHLHPDPNCKDARIPKSRETYWAPKLARNVERDAQQIAELESGGWNVLIVWECQATNSATLELVRNFLEPSAKIRPAR